MEKIRNIFEMLKFIQLRPWMYLIKKKSIYSLLEFKYWYQIWVGSSGFGDVLLYEKFHEFQDYIIEHTIWRKNATNDCWKYWDCLLKVSNWDEEKAFDLFFELMDKFMIQENIILGPEILNAYKKRQEI